MSDPKTPTAGMPKAVPDESPKITPDNGVVIPDSDLDAIVGGGMIDTCKSHV